MMSHESWYLKSSSTWQSVQFKLTSRKTSNFHITGPLWGESTGDWWIPLTKGQKCRVLPCHDIIMEIKVWCVFYLHSCCPISNITLCHIIMLVNLYNDAAILAVHKQNYLPSEQHFAPNIINLPPLFLLVRKVFSNSQAISTPVNMNACKPITFYLQNEYKPIWIYKPFTKELTHWGRVTHICVNKLTIIGSDNGLSPGRRPAIIWTNAGILLIGPLGTNFSEILIEIRAFSFKKMHLKVSSGKRRPFCLGLNVLRYLDIEYSQWNQNVITGGLQCQNSFCPLVTCDLPQNGLLRFLTWMSFRPPVRIP